MGLGSFVASLPRNLPPPPVPKPRPTGFQLGSQSRSKLQLPHNLRRQLVINPIQSAHPVRTSSRTAPQPMHGPTTTFLFIARCLWHTCASALILKKRAYHPFADRRGDPECQWLLSRPLLHGRTASRSGRRRRSQC